jgi:hypothetical protein
VYSFSKVNIATIRQEIAHKKYEVKLKNDNKKTVYPKGEEGKDIRTKKHVYRRKISVKDKLKGEKEEV